MRTIYLAFTGEELRGVNNKIIAQHTAFLNACSRHITYVITNQNVANSTFKKYSCDSLRIINKSGLGSNRVVQRIKLFRELSNQIDLSEEIGFIYIRYPRSDIGLSLFVRKYSRCNVVFEHNDKETNVSNWYRFSLEMISELIFGRYVRKKARCGVCVTTEILEYQIRRGYAKEHLLLQSNGVDTNKYELRETQLAADLRPKDIKLIFVGSPYKAHGLDRIIRAMSLDTNNTVSDFFIIGSSNYVDTYRSMVLDLKLSKRVHFLGFLDYQEYKALYDECDLAIEVLAPHRKSLHQTASLKAREYCAVGIPYLSASKDPDIQNNIGDYIVTVPATDDPVDLTLIRDFINDLNRGQCAQELRSFSLEFLSWDEKVKNVHRFVAALET